MRVETFIYNGVSLCNLNYLYLSAITNGKGLELCCSVLALGPYSPEVYCKQKNILQETSFPLMALHGL